jgi:hypothetical protein
MEETMKSNLWISLSIAFVFLFLFTACGQSAPTPITNPPGVETSLASTALAYAKQTEAANPFTATPSPTPTQTPTPTPRISLNGTSLVVREDQSALFTDHKLGYQITIPAGWLAVRLNEDEYYQAFTLEAVAQNPAITDFLSKIQTLNSNLVRLVAIDLEGGDSANGLISGISVILQPETIKTIDDWVIANQARSKKVKGYQFLSSQSQETASAIKVVVREEKSSSTTGEIVYSRKILLNLPSGILLIDFETDLDTKDTNLPDFEQVVNSLILLNPE